MKPRQYRPAMPLDTSRRNPRKSAQQMTLEKAQKAHEQRRGKTQRQLLIEAGIITPRKQRR